MNAADMNLVRHVIAKPVTARAIQFKDDVVTLDAIHHLLDHCDRILRATYRYLGSDTPNLLIPNGDLHVSVWEGEWILLRDDGTVESMTEDEFYDRFESHTTQP